MKLWIVWFLLVLACSLAVAVPSFAYPEYASYIFVGSAGVFMGFTCMSWANKLTS